MYTANRQAGDVQGLDLFTLQAHARALRAEAVAELAGKALFAAGRALRKSWYVLEQNRVDRALRRELSRLDAHTLRDLGLSPVTISSITSEALTDHPMATANAPVAAPVGRPANENATGGSQQVRTAA